MNQKRVPSLFIALVAVTATAISARALAVDCNNNRIEDACDLDCGPAGGPCDVPGCGAGFDCDSNSTLDECDLAQCPVIEVVFLIDTSSSITQQEITDLCGEFDTVVENLAIDGIQVNEERLQIWREGVDCVCCAATVENTYGLTTPGLPEELGDCVFDVERREDWKPATAVVAGNKTWGPGPRIIIPVSDDGPRCGDPIDDEDHDVIEHAIPIVAGNRVIVGPVIAKEEPVLEELAQDLANGGEPCGAVFDLDDPFLAARLVDFIRGVCPTDCNANGIPDRCDIDQCGGDPACEDCNRNCTLDICEFGLPGHDCCSEHPEPGCSDTFITECVCSGSPDCCDPINGEWHDGCVFDVQFWGCASCDVLPAEDCNCNRVPDECDISGGASLDANADGVPDECEIIVDCNGNEVLDSCDIAGCDPLVEPACGDCNGNAVPDGCDIAAGASLDVNANGIPDECVPLPAPYPHDRRKNRYISFDPNKAVMGGASLAFKIELIDIKQGSCNGADSGPCRYPQGTGINEPGDADCRRCAGGPSSGQPCISGPIDCVGFACNQGAETCSNDDPQIGGSNVGLVRWVASWPRGTNAHFLAVTEGDREVRLGEDWPEVIHVGDGEIVPQASYGIRAVDVESAAESEELIVSTIPRPAHGVYAWWADTVSVKAKYCNNGLPSGTTCVTDAECGSTPGSCVLGWGPPNGFTNADDLVAAISVFSAFGPNWVNPVEPGPMATPQVADITWVDLFGWTPDSRSNASDVQQIGLAFQGRPYPYIDPADCLDLAASAPEGGDSVPEEGMMGGEMDGPLTFGGMTIVPSTDLIQANQTVDVEVFADTVENLGAYQVSIEVTGGSAGSLELEAVSIDTGRADFVFASASVSSGTSMNGASLMAVLMNPGGWVFEGPAYLGRFTYRASPDAGGVFTVSVRAEPASFLNDAAGSVIEASTEAATLVGCGVECMTDGHCEDADECTVDTCVANVCTFNPGPAGVTCDDGKFCTVGEECDGAGTCAGGTSPCQPGEHCCKLWNECRTGSCALPPQ